MPVICAQTHLRPNDAIYHSRCRLTGIRYLDKHAQSLVQQGHEYSKELEPINSALSSECTAMGGMVSLRQSARDHSSLRHHPLDNHVEKLQILGVSKDEQGNSRQVKWAIFTPDKYANKTNQLMLLPITASHHVSGCSSQITYYLQASVDASIFEISDIVLGIQIHANSSGGQRAVILGLESCPFLDAPLKASEQRTGHKSGRMRSLILRQEGADGPDDETVKPLALKTNPATGILGLRLGANPGSRS